jgi:adenosylcobinamide-GDP ribazoletransferase
MSEPSPRRDQLLIGFAFLTRLRLRPSGGSPQLPLAEAAWSFPVVGAAVGALGALVALIARWWGLPPLAVGLLALAATALATGALHEDGLADTADGFGGGATAERKLEIMRDSRIGTYGVLALLLILGLRASALAALGEVGVGALLWGLVASHAGARAVLPALMHRLPAARDAGLGHAAGVPDGTQAMQAAAIGAIILLVGLGFGGGVSAIVAAILVAAGMSALARRQIGGLTGDVLGATEQLVETAILLAIL